jgi:hypothetical protein
MPRAFTLGLAAAARWSGVALSIAMASCSAATTPRAKLARSGPAESDAVCRYAVIVRQVPKLEVEVRCPPTVEAFVALQPLTAAHVQLEAGGHAIQRSGDRWPIPPLARGRVVRYRVDLSALAEHAQHRDVARRAGGTVVAPGRSWILVPEPGAERIVEVRAEQGPLLLGGPGTGGSFRMAAHEIDSLSGYAVIGPVSSRALELPAGTGRMWIDQVLLPGRLDVSRAALERWVRRSVDATTSIYRAPPIARLLLVVLPVEAAPGVVNGSVRGSSVVVLIGEDADEDALATDPILTHELLHLGLPRLQPDAEWLAEGIPTYLSWLALARTGAIEPARFWTTLALARSRIETEPRWAGALGCLELDRAARSLSGGQLGLEDAIRRLRELSWPHTQSWRPAEVLALLRQQIGVRLGSISSPERADRTFELLGIHRSEQGVELKASGADLRALMVRGDAARDISAGAGRLEIRHGESQREIPSCRGTKWHQREERTGCVID